MYFALELNGRRRVVVGRQGAGISEVTRKAFGNVDADARVIKASKSRSVAEHALFDDAFARGFKLQEVA